MSFENFYFAQQSSKDSIQILIFGAKVKYTYPEYEEEVRLRDSFPLVTM
jgi:hypothetical protein